MSSRQLFTLLTDFGTRDSYVAQMKAVLLRGCELNCEIVDITHEVAPHDIHGASFLLHEVIAPFSAGVIHVAVVDPGVGGSRRRVAAKLKDPAAYVIAPDNGLLSVLLHEGMVEQVWEIAQLELLSERRRRSMTFDGRDVFAPTAVFLANAGEPTKLGPQISLEDLLTFDDCRIVRLKAGSASGRIVRIDHFGNAVTNLLAEQVRPSRVTVAGKRLEIAQNYSEIGCAAALVGSSGFIEISCNQQPANRELGLNVGETVEVLSEN